MVAKPPGWSVATHEWGTRMLLKHYLDLGLTKAELSRRFGVSRRTIHYWIDSGQPGSRLGHWPDALLATTGGHEPA